MGLWLQLQLYTPTRGNVQSFGRPSTSLQSMVMKCGVATYKSADIIYCVVCLVTRKYVERKE